MANIIPIILSGGSGTRLWPLSRAKRPKQFIDIIGKGSLFQQTIQRLQSIDGIGDPIIVCNDSHRFTVAEQLQEIGAANNTIILEATGRNTAPAVATAAIKLAEIDQSAAHLMLVLPADHLIANPENFIDALKQAQTAAEQGALMTFGIVADQPATGFGYIKADTQHTAPYAVQEFVEKPDLATAKQYIESGNYFWNSGMFLFSAKTYITELETYAPDILSHVRAAIKDATTDLDFLRLEDKYYAQCEDISIDYAVMEKSSKVSVVPLDAGWSDIGSWSALWSASTKDNDGNSLHGDVVAIDTHNSYVKSSSRLVTTLGLEDIIVVETTDGILVASKKSDQDIKKLVQTLKDQNRKEVGAHRMDFRPWGSFDSLDKGERFQVKRLIVKPGQSISMQKHHHRAEHWIVVSGTAEVTCNDEILMLSENESVYIPLGARHRLANPGKIPLEIIEVQSGSYLGEDDIVRFDDIYGRN